MHKLPFKKFRHKMSDYWRELMHSKHKKMTRGAEYLARMFPWARGESWRRRDKKK